MKKLENISSDTLFFLVSTFISIFYYWLLFIYGDFVYLQYDAYYYASIAKSVINGAGLYDLTNIPETPVRTPQNGIVFILIFLEFIGIETIESKLYIIGFVNCILITLSGFCVFKITKNLNIHPQAGFLIAITLPLTYYYNVVLLQPINDGIYFFLSLLSVYLLTRININQHHKYGLISISALISTFRLSGVLVFITAFLTSFIANTQWRKGFLALTVFVSILIPIVFFSLFIDAGGFEGRAKEISGGYNLDYFISHLWKMIAISLPEALFRFTYHTTGMIMTAWLGVAVSITLFVVISVVSYRAYSQKNYSVVYIVVFILLNLVLFQVHSAQPTRYLIAISPLLPLLIMLILPLDKQKLIAVVFTCITVIVSVIAFALSDKYEQARMKHQYADSMHIYLKDKEYELISFFPRVTYFLLDKRSYQDIKETTAYKKGGRLLVVGSRDYLSWMVSEFKKNDDRKIIDSKLLPYYYIDYTRRIKPHLHSGYIATHIYSLWLETK